ncbi:histidine--tRNA ligase, cytoplasmic [Amborella trichopoda]|uniref:Histidine--tRNA ligase, cytoplasmic n=1 Tax=Amborella trichopoda TaxID=13333 RepID=U5DCH0_AMBTC|nr:histidine--tRNA ligase, cytoplasmic [Amborella trichopoda]ERN19930.1 hypothetical protein AMTR_s00071p00100010 [Amborella trichopoda]|eukprot:XP_006858463.1 histidine--tRNA ligase, cytoplasmic [Amborella trichopoda]
MASGDKTVIIGGRGVALTSESIYGIAHGLCNVQIDSSALDKISNSTNQSKPRVKVSEPTVNIVESSRVLYSPEQSRASLAVLLNKLVSSSSSLRGSGLVVRIVEILNRKVPLALPCSESNYTDNSFLSGDGDRSFGVSNDEREVFELSCSNIIGVSSLVDHFAGAFSTVMDVISALSFEALRADTSVFDLNVSGDGFSHKDEIEVASDMRMLLFGSKLVNGPKMAESEEKDSAFSSIPSAHGGFKTCVKSLHSRTRIELNSEIDTKKKKARYRPHCNTLTNTILPIVASLHSAGKASLARVNLIIKSIENVEQQLRISEAFSKTCTSENELRNGFRSILLKFEENSSEFLVEVSRLLDRVKDIFAWEAALGLFLLQTIEKGRTSKANNSAVENSGSIIEPSGSNAVVNGEGGEVKGKPKGEKKKKKNPEIVLGKGTTVVHKIISGVIQQRLKREYATDEYAEMLVDWASEISLFFEPKDSELAILLEAVKTVVESNETRRIPKIPKGTRDFGKEQMAIRERAFSIIVGVFKRHGGVALDTPVFELRETLMGKYGEDSKLIYDLADQGGEICSLRYDLTVPFARYVAMNGITMLKRYHIAKVYRRDNPSKGRFREFYQCDFDIAGQFPLMQPDFEVIKVMTELLDELNIGEYEIKLNHRKLLDGMLEICGVPSNKFRTVCSSIDKLDKQSFEQVHKELVEDKGLTIEMAESIGSFVKKRGHPLQILADLQHENSPFLKNDGSLVALKELEILFRALEKSKCIDRVVFDLSLARGLDYYTGVIYEAIFKGATQVGSIAAGGRYDNLVGMFGSKQVPAVGVSLGIERVFTIMEQLQKDKKKTIRASETQVLVVLFGDDLGEAAALSSELWNAKIKAEFVLTSSKKISKQIDYVVQSCIPWMIIVGDDELERGVVKMKDIMANKQVEVPRERIVGELQAKLRTINECSSEHNVVV